MPDDADATSDKNSYLMLLLGMVIFGSATPVSKLISQAFPVFLASGARMTLGALLLTPLLWRHRDELRDMSRADWWVVAGIAVFGMVGFSLTMLYGMSMVSGVVGSVVMSTAPAVTALGAALFLGDSVGWRKWLAVALAVAGVLVINVSGEGVQSSGWTLIGGIGLVFAAVCCEAAYTLLGKRATQSVRPLTASALAVLGAVVLFAGPAIWQATRFDWSVPTLEDWLALAWWGSATLALGSILWYRGVQGVPGSVAAGFMGVMPVSALVLSYVLLGEDFHWLHVVGFGLVVAGVFLISWAHAHHKDDADDADADPTRDDDAQRRERAPHPTREHPALAAHDHGL